MRAFRLLLIVLVVCTLNSCRTNLTKTVHNLYGKRINFSWHNVKITGDELQEDYYSISPIKIALYVDTAMCTPCIRNYLKNASNYIQSLQNDDIELLCILQKRSTNEVQSLLKEVDLSGISVINDINNKYLETNSLEKNAPVVNSFLLDKNNQVLLVGDPLRNMKVRDLYDERIKEMTNIKN